jgi:DNA-binding MarR family transcriptional regulator
MKRIEQPQSHPASRQLKEHVLWERPGFLLRRLNQIHYALFFECCKAFSITPVQYGLLSVLAHSMGPLDQTSLCAEVGIDRTTVADVTRRLSRRGLLEQHRSADDGRQKLTRITADGRTLTVTMYENMRQAQEALLEPLGQKERGTFLKSLVKLVIAHNDCGHTPVKVFE